MAKDKDPVRIRYKTISDGRKSIYLDIYVNGSRRYEFLRLYLLPATRANKTKNDETMRLANAVKAKRIVEIQNGRFGFDADNKVMLYPYIQKMINDREQKGMSVNSVRVWKSLLVHLRRFERRDSFRLAEITPLWLSAFKTHLRREKNVKTGEILNINSQSIYYSKLVAVINQAERDGLITKNPTKSVQSPRMEETERMYLTIDEVKRISIAPCPNEGTKRAFLFSCLTGLRKSDVGRLRWKDVDDAGDGCMIVFRQQKTSDVEYMYISKQARKLMGDRGEDNCIVFPLVSDYCTNKHLKKWMESAGIKKHITFHCARHTFATMMLTLGNDIYTTSKLLGHKSITTTQIYAKIVDEKKRSAVDSIPDIIS